MPSAPIRILAALGRSRSLGMLAVALFASALTLGGSAWLNANAASSPAINACVLKYPGTTGYVGTSGNVRLLSPGQSCKSSIEVPVSWFSEGPQGPQGIPGPQGLQGIQGPKGNPGTLNLYLKSEDKVLTANSLINWAPSCDPGDLVISGGVQGTSFQDNVIRSHPSDLGLNRWQLGVYNEGVETTVQSMLLCADITP